jgi:hypothetical protein
MVPGGDEKGTRLHSLVSLWAGRDDGHTAASTLADSNSSLCSSVDRGQEWMTNAIGWSESQCQAICSTKAAMTVVADPLSSQKKKKARLERRATTGLYIRPRAMNGVRSKRQRTPLFTCPNNNDNTATRIS